MSTHILAGSDRELSHLKSKRIKNAKTVEQFLLSDGRPEVGAVYVVIGKAPAKVLEQLKSMAQRTTAAVVTVIGQAVELAVRPPKKPVQS